MYRLEFLTVLDQFLYWIGLYVDKGNSTMLTGKR